MGSWGWVPRVFRGGRGGGGLVAKEAVSEAWCGTASRRFELRHGNIGHPAQNLRGRIQF